MRKLILLLVLAFLLTTLIINADSKVYLGYANVRIKYCIETKIPYNIYLDGKYMGKTDKFGILQIKNIPAGMHKYSAVRQDKQYSGYAYKKMICFPNFINVQFIDIDVGLPYVKNWRWQVIK